MLVVIASQNELPLIKEYGYDGQPILITGVGGMNVINSLKNIPKNEYIINIGYVGSNTLPIGKDIVVGDVKTYHENVDFNERVYKHLGGNIPCYTSTDFVIKTKIKEPCVFDMELAFIIALGFENVRSLKRVSDNLNINQYEKFIKE